MKKSIIISLFLLAVLTAGAQERIFQLWNLNNVEVQLNEKLSLGANEKMHYRPESGEVNLKFGDLYLKRRFTSWFDVAVAGRMLWSKNEAGWTQEYRPMVYGNLKTEMRQFRFELSNRLEYRMYKTLNDYFRHRHMLLAETCPFNQVEWFRLYLSEEAYFRFDEAHFHLARISSGTKIRCCSYLEMKLYYVYEKSRKPAYWQTSDILGLNLNIDI